MTFVRNQTVCKSVKISTR